MRYANNSALLKPLPNHLLDHSIRLTIYTARRFINNQYTTLT